MAEKRARKQRELRTPVSLDGLVTFVGKKAGSWEGLKDRVVARRINRVRVGERCRECRSLESIEIGVGRGAQLISQLAPVDEPVGGPPVYGAQPRKGKPQKKRGKQAAREVNPEPMSGVLGEDNRYYLTVVLGGKTCRALFDPGATCSLIGPALTKHFTQDLLPSNSRIRSFSGTISKIAGILPALLEIDGIEKRIDFRAVPSIQQEMLLGTDFCDVFRLSLNQAKGIWRANRTEHWYRFSSEETGTHPTLTITARLAGVTRTGDLGNAGVGTMEEMTCCALEERMMREAGVNVGSC